MNLSKILYSILILGATLSACNSQEPNQDPPPNFIVILADDLGYGGLAAYGDKNLQTPNIDHLSANGVRFTDFHSNAPVCSPTRAALMTGNYQQRSGMEGVIYVRGETRKVGLDTGQVTVAKLLKSAGYQTGIMGKWHLGYQKQYNPVYHGFDTFYGYLSGNIDYHSHYDNAGIYDWWHNLDSIYEEGYATDLITQHAVDFIETNKEKPFFLYVSHEAPHVPFQGRNDPGYRFPGKEFSYHGPVEDTLKVYNEMVEVMDEGVGEIMDALREAGLEENTLVLFISDNGAEVFGNNGKLSGNKGNLLEGGHRVPGIAYWKGKIKPGESAETILSMDILPTLLEMSGVDFPEKTIFDGVDFSKHLFTEEPLQERTLFWRYRNQKVARHQEWKLLLSDKDTLLVNLEQDPLEKHNLAIEKPGILKELLDKLGIWEKEMGPVEKMKTI